MTWTRVHLSDKFPADFFGRKFSPDPEGLFMRHYQVGIQHRFLIGHIPYTGIAQIKCFSLELARQYLIPSEEPADQATCDLLDQFVTKPHWEQWTSTRPDGTEDE